VAEYPLVCFDCIGEVVKSAGGDDSYGKTREGVPCCVQFKVAAPCRSRRLGCRGFGVQHLWFCYRREGSAKKGRVRGSGTLRESRCGALRGPRRAQRQA
jgi:hypothetical protein